MQVNARMIGAGVAAALAAGLGYALFFNNEDEVDYDTILRDGAYSVRSYPQLVIAETVVVGLRESARALGLLKLADYLERCGGGSPLAIAAPLLVDGDEDGRGWRTRILLPVSLSQHLPANDGVRVRTLPPRRLAATRFSGAADDDALAGREVNLRQWMETRGLRAAGPVEHAFYSAPFVPAPLRRNEVLIPLAA